jgi:Tfp pilus assembly protein FimV
MRRNQAEMKRSCANGVVVIGAVMLTAGGIGAAEKPSAMADLQRSIQQSRAAVQNQAAQTQAVQAQQRAEGVASGGIGVQVVDPGERAPLAPTTPSHCVTRYTGANVFTDCR